MKIQPRRFSAHCVAVQADVVSSSLGSNPKLSALIFKRAKNACPLLWSLRIDERPVFGSLHAAVDFSRVGHPLHELRRGRQVRQKMGENLLRRLYEEPIRDSFRLIQRNRQSLGFGLAAKLFRRVPVRHPCIEWIEHDVAAMRIVELLYKLAGRVINDGAVPAGVHLIEHLANDA